MSPPAAGWAPVAPGKGREGGERESVSVAGVGQGQQRPVTTACGGGEEVQRWGEAAFRRRRQWGRWPDAARRRVWPRRCGAPADRGGGWPGADPASPLRRDGMEIWDMGRPMRCRCTARRRFALGLFTGPALRGRGGRTPAEVAWGGGAGDGGSVGFRCRPPAGRAGAAGRAAAVGCSRRNGCCGQSPLRSMHGASRYLPLARRGAAGSVVGWVAAFGPQRGEGERRGGKKKTAWIGTVIWPRRAMERRWAGWESP